MGLRFFIKDVEIGYGYAQLSSKCDDVDLDGVHPTFLKESFTQHICDNLAGRVGDLPEIVNLISRILAMKGHYLIDIIDVTVISDDTLTVTSGAPDNEICKRLYSRPEIHIYPLR